MNFLKLRYDPDIGLPCAVMKTASNPTDLIKENMLCNNYTITAKHLQFFLPMKFGFVRLYEFNST